MNKPTVINNYSELKKWLGVYAEDEYREFSKKSIVSERPILGVRVPKVRELASKIPSEKIEVFLKRKPVTLEEVLARGFLICRLPYDEMVLQFDSQIEYIDDWATCDLFCSGLKKSLKKHLDEFLELKVFGLLESEREFAVRVGLVLLKCYYVNAEYLEVIFESVERLAGREEYYVKMAIAWLLAECFIKYPAATTGYMLASSLPNWTFNKTISKICDSYRVDDETKKMLRKMRK